MDLNILATGLSIVSGVIGAGYTAWKFFILPGKKFKEKIKSQVNKLELRIDALEKDYADLEEDYDEKLKEVKEDHSKLSNDVNSQFIRVEQKNEKLLDLIIRYFSN